MDTLGGAPSRVRHELCVVGETKQAHFFNGIPNILALCGDKEHIHLLSVCLINSERSHHPSEGWRDVSVTSR